MRPSPASAPPSAWSRLKASFGASFGDIVFGMEEGSVSIFGLVFGVAASTAIVLNALGIGRAKIGCLRPGSAR